MGCRARGAHYPVAVMGVGSPNASPVVTIGIAGLSCLLLAGWSVLVWRAARPEERRGLTLRFTAMTVGWAALTLGLAAAGVFARVEDRPPPFMLIPVGLVVGVVLLARSRFGPLLAASPLWILVGMQAFRLPLELVMHQAALEGTMPAQMTFGSVRGDSGLNYDIVTGITALVLALGLRFGRVPRAVVLAWNVLGTLLLFVIVSVALLSTPLFAYFGSAPERLNTWILFAPFIWLPAVLVGSALLGHVLVFRALVREREPAKGPLGVSARRARSRLSAARARSRCRRLDGER